MIKMELKRLIFNILEIWFSEDLYDVEGYSHVMFRNCSPQKNHLGFSCKEELTSEIDLNQNLDTIWDNMKNNSCRKQIKRAEKRGVTIKLNQDFDKFFEIYESHLKQKKYLVLKDNKYILKKYCTLFTAEINGNVLCGHIFLEDDNHIYSYRSAAKITNDKNTNTLRGNANNLILWEAIKYAKEKGIQKFDFGGLSTESINSFKESFGGKRAVYYNYWKDYDMKYRMASCLGRHYYELRQNACKSIFIVFISDLASIGLNLCSYQN